ncbi:hypothetical protein RF11_01588 [Thelohanellus kitauei]|uniref:Uncharacterized protein n=1 Tax=Thelohanellus kitauei TaxID=669202 RepID=A0A0C2MWJ0_THEKT|nr:hypothetical protein RF11_01588 [Thelohanellus kitauei]
MSLSKDHSRNLDVESIYLNMMYVAEIMKELDEWEKAGDGYVTAAQIAEFHEIPHISIIKTYKRSIPCFLRIRSTRAYDSFHSVVDCYLKDNQIQKAIEHCIKYGYVIRNVFWDRYRSREFYEQADYLRIRHQIPHRCAIREFDRNKYDILEKAHDDFQNVGF